MLNNLKISRFLWCSLIITTQLHAQETLDWNNDIPTGGWPSGSLGPHSNTSQCNSRGSLIAEITNPFGVPFPAGQGLPFGSAVNNNSIILGMSSVDDEEGITQTIDFTYPVENLSFSIFDIDGNPGNWQDRIIITANSGGSSMPVTISTCPTAVGTTCSGSGTSSAQIDADIAPTGFTAATGRADITIDGSIDSVSIQYLNHTVPTSTTQFISISEFTYSCAIIGTSKVMTRRAGQADNISPYIVDIDFNFENFGDLTISNLTALEDLNAVFNLPPNASNFSVTSITQTSGPGTFNENTSFDGDGNTELIAAGSSLAPSQSASIRVSLLVNNYDAYTNSITFTGTTPQMATTSDDSTDGTIPDGADADDNPDESTPSQLNVQTLPVSLNYLASSKSGDQTTIEWQTDIEFNHIGFKLYQENNNGEKTAVSDIITTPQEQLDQSLKTYKYNTTRLSNQPLWLAELSNTNETTWYGPIYVNAREGQKIEQAQIIKPSTRSINQQNSGNVVSQNDDLALVISESGMYRVTYNDLTQAGFNFSGASPRDINILLDGDAVPIYINGNQQSFDTTTSFDFYAEGFDSIYTNERHYHLTTNTQHRKASIQDDNTSASSEISTWYWQTDSYDDNLVYDFSSPTNDPWRAETLSTFGNTIKNLQFPLDELYEDSAEKITLQVNISGAIDYGQPPTNLPNDPERCGATHPDLYLGMPNDHCVELSVNGKVQEEIVFDGLTYLSNDYQLDHSIAASGAIDVSLRLPGETAFDHDIINIDTITLRYPRRTTAINDVLYNSIHTETTNLQDLISQDSFEQQVVIDSLNITTGSSLSFSVDGFNNNQIIAYALQTNAPLRINNLSIKADANQFKVQIPAVALNNKYWVSTEQRLLKPTITSWHQAQNIIHRNADYVMIAHPEFIETADQLKQYHENNGLNVEIVNVEDIYAQYSSSIIDPYAIKSYIKELAKYNRLNYVLLIGSDNYDYKRYLSDQNFSHIPSLYTALDNVIRYTPADSLFTDTDNDDIPDIAIGRLPARNNQELQLLINKQMTFIEQNNENISAHFIADAQDDNYSYTNISNELMSLLPNSWTTMSSYRDSFSSTEATKQNIINNFAANPRLTTYLGHSGPRNWFSFPSAFNYNDINSLENNQSASVIVQWGCWNSYYVEPSANTMAHRFLFDSENGAVAVFGASSLTQVSSEQAFAELLLPEFTKLNQSIGVSMINAKKQLALSGNYRDVIIGWNLLGDPALLITRPNTLQ